MPNVSTPKAFFVNERRMYSNWQFAVWREFFQNSLDAGSSRINISMKNLDNGNFEIVFEDNGCGMTREVLEKVYFSLGETTKRDSSTVGGFGRARILTCFSMKSYKIRTMNSLVIGDGGSYEIENADPVFGTTVTIEVENESFESMNNWLTWYLQLSQMDCRVFVNGEQWKSWCYRRQHTRELSTNGQVFADVYVNKSAKNNRLIIRVNGTIMYYINIKANAQVIVEIKPELARNVLTANRDGMNSLYQPSLTSFLDEIATETMSALKVKRGQKSARIKRGGLLFTRAKRIESKKVTKAQVEDANRAPSVRSVAGIKLGLSIGTAKETPETVLVAHIHEELSKIIPTNEEIVSSDIEHLFRKASSVSEGISPSSVEEKVPGVGDRFIENLPDIMIDDDAEIPSIRRIIDSYNPENWVIAMGQGGKTYNKGGTLYKLLMLWKIACESAVDSLLDHLNRTSTNPVNGLNWGIGWVFNEQSKARCYASPEANFLLLNPVDLDGNMDFSISKKQDRKRLMALAKHEVAHVLCQYHDEAYASTLTSIDELFDEKVAHQKMQEFLREEA